MGAARNFQPDRRCAADLPRIATAIALFVAALAACRQPPQPAISLLDHLGEAEAVQDVAGSSLMVPANDARRLEGWSEPEPGPDHTAALWAMGEKSSLKFFLVTPRPLRLALLAHPFPYPGAPEARLVLTLNETPLPAVVLQSGWQDTAATVDFPSAALRPGWNCLAISHPWARRPVEFGQSDPRPLAVNFSRLDLLEAAGSPVRTAQNVPAAAGQPPPCTVERCLLGAGEARRWSFLLPAHAQLQVRAAGAGARLRVMIDQDGGYPRELRAQELQGEPRSFAVALGGRVEDPAVLTLAADGGPVELLAAGLSARAWPEEWRAPAAAAATVVPLTATPNPAASSKPQTVLIFLVDALRADHLSVYGYARPTSPRLAQFAQSAERYDDALAVTSWTKPAVATLLTGLPPEGHGAGLNLSPLRPEVAYLPEQFRAAGYRTAAISASPNVNAPLGFARGFDEFNYLPPDGNMAAPATAVIAALARTLRDAPAAQPLFLYVHILEPHTPYLPPVEFNRFLTPGLNVPGGFDLSPLGLPFAPPAILQSRRDRYDGEVLAADDAFGRALELLHAAGRGQHALLIFIADHGEEFGEHDGLEHGESLYPEVLRIPLLIRWPDGHGANAVNGAPVSQLDLAPTLRLAAGMPAAAASGGFPLQGPLPATRRRYASLLDGGAVESLRDGRWELQWIHRRAHFPGKASVQLYDLGADPGELHNLAAQYPVRTALLQARLRRAAPARAAAAAQADNAELLKQLKALGYLH